MKITEEQFQQQVKISEADFASQVEDLLERFGWKWVHMRPARVLRHRKETYETAYSGHKEFLDYLAIRAPRILVAELKPGTGKLSPEQEEWLKAWEDCQRAVTVEPINVGNKWQTHRVINGLKFFVLPEVYVWRPEDWNEIVECLK